MNVFLDIEKAFDRVWHNGLRYELLHMNAPALLLRWISSFLRDRTVKVRILGHTSWEIAIDYGVPPGSHISPLLFLLYLSKLPKLVPNTHRSLFADDFMFYAESSIVDSHLIQSNFQTSLDKLTVFNSDHRIILSCTKSVRMLFERRKCKKRKPQDVSYNGQVIPASTSVKFLGITFDSALTFSLSYSRQYRLSLPPENEFYLYLNLWPFYFYPHLSLQSLHPFAVWLWCASYMHCLSPCTTYMGGGTNTLHNASTFHSMLIHNDRKRQHAYLPPIHDRKLYLAKRWYRRAMLHSSGLQDYVDNHTHNQRTYTGSRNIRNYSSIGKPQEKVIVNQNK